jgi:hypothetical protein
MQYASWILLFAFLVASITGYLGHGLVAVGIAFVAGNAFGLACGFVLSEAANLYERWK